MESMQADQRAVLFFISFLNEAQLEVFNTRRYVDVLAPTGDRFRIACGGHQTDVMWFTRQGRKNEMVQFGCVHLNVFDFPRADTWIAQYLAIMADTTRFLDVTNWGAPVEATYWRGHYDKYARQTYAYVCDPWKDLR